MANPAARAAQLAKKPASNLMQPFFPDLYFGFAFAAILIAGLCVATWHDVRTLRVPKKITMTLLALGFLMNLVRGVWLGAQGHTPWVMDSGAFVGGLDGLLFSFCGALAGFLLFFVIWIVGIGGGADVKLATAIGAWFGPFYFLFVLGFTLPVLMFLGIGRLIIAVLRGRPSSVSQGGVTKKTGWRLLNFSLPLTIAVIAAFLIGFLQIRIQAVPQQP